MSGGIDKFTRRWREAELADVAVTLLQPSPWLVERGLLTVFPLGVEQREALSRARAFGKRVCIRSSASPLDCELMNGSRRWLGQERFDELWHAVLRMPLGAILGTAFLDHEHVGDRLNSSRALRDIPEGTRITSLLEFEAIDSPLFVDGPDEQLMPMPFRLGALPGQGQLMLV